jgi:hypothetical protein
MTGILLNLGSMFELKKKAAKAVFFISTLYNVR